MRKKSAAKPQWKFGNLLDNRAKQEIGAFYEALAQSKKSKRAIVGYPYAILSAMKGETK